MPGKSARKIQGKALAAKSGIRKTKFKTIRNNRKNASQSLTIEGVDTFPIPITDRKGMTMALNIIANPLFWEGTRIAGIAKVYQKYRPKWLKFIYEPACPATTAGTATFGIIENGMAISSGQVTTTLLNSGGKNINIYESSFLLYKPRLRDACYTEGDLTRPVVNPFTFFLYTNTEANISPGLVKVEWTYEFQQGSGDNQLPVTVVTRTTPENIIMLQSFHTFYSDAKLTFGWGAVLGWLKKHVVPVLRKIAVVICESVIGSLGDNQRNNAVMTETVQIREGTILTIDPSDVYSSPENKTRVKDSNGTDYYLPDSARVSIYMSGETVTATNIQSAPAYKYFNIRFHDNVEQVVTQDSSVAAPPAELGSCDYWVQFDVRKDANNYIGCKAGFRRNLSLTKLLCKPFTDTGPRMGVDLMYTNQWVETPDDDIALTAELNETAFPDVFMNSSQMPCYLPVLIYKKNPLAQANWSNWLELKPYLV